MQHVVAGRNYVFLMGIVLDSEGLLSKLLKGGRWIMNRTTKNESVSIVIPAYNEEDTIKGVIIGINKTLKNAKINYEIIVVNDGSTDNTSRVAKELGVEVIDHPYNKGYGASIKSGIRKALYDVIFLVDADGQHNPNDILEILKYMNEYEMVIGTRKRGSYVPIFRRPGKWILSIVANYLSNSKIPDLNSGFRAIKKKKVLEFMNILPNGFSFSTTITLAMLKSAYNVKYAPIAVSKRVGTKSSVNLFKDGLQTLLLIIRVIVLFNPLKVFVPASIILFVVGFLYALFVLIFLQLHIPSGAILLIISSFIVFFFGILADQISALRRGKE